MICCGFFKENAIAKIANVNKNRASGEASGEAVVASLNFCYAVQDVTQERFSVCTVYCLNGHS